MILGLYVWTIGLVSLVCNRKHLMLILLSFELMVMGLFILIMVYYLAGMFQYLFWFLIMAVIESCFGISLLVLMNFSQGTDSLINFNLMNC